MSEQQSGAVVLLSDSEALFRDDALVAKRIAALAGEPGAPAAYLGASNGDRPEFFEIFVAAMERAGLGECRHIHAEASAGDLAFLRAARVAMLAGGDVERGMQALRAEAISDALHALHREGAVLAGVSAGAVQLGVGWIEPGDRALRAGLGVLPLVIGVHEEPDWPRLDAAVRAAGGYTPGLGLARGGGAVVHPGGEIEPIHRAACEIATVAFGHRHSLLSPALP